MATNSTKQSAIRLNCILFWAQLTKPNKKSKKHQVDLTNLSAAAVKALQASGIKVKTRDDKPEMGAYITCKSKNIIKAYDSNGVQLDVQVGNGSSAIATVAPYAWTYDGDRGISPTLNRLTVTNLIEFDGAEDEDEAGEAL